jgi:predicted membrane protein
MAERGRIIFGLLLLGAGVIFLLDLADVVDAWNIVSSWWPAIFIVFGLIALLSQPRSLMSGGILIAIGAVLLVATLDILDVAVWQLAIPAVLIGTGAGLMFRGLRPSGTADHSNRVSSMVVLGENHINSRASAFKRGTLTSILGEMSLDLREASIEPSGAVVDVFSLLSDVKIYVPQDVLVHSNGMPILGDFEDKSSPVEAPADGRREITFTGVSILGDVEIRNR